MSTATRVHLVAGGFPPGQHAGHDMDFARLRILEALQKDPQVHTTVTGDFTDCDKWLGDCQLLITYVAGPFADDHQASVIREWLNGGGRWLALHGSSGGKAVRTGRDDGARKWVKTEHHEVLGGFFLTHPPIREMNVTVENATHPLTKGLPNTFKVQDEPYLVEVMHDDTQVLLSTKDIDVPRAVAEIYGDDHSLLEDGESHALGFVRDIGKGSVAYIALGHTHSPTTNMQVSVHETVSEDRVPPLDFRGVWETDVYNQIISNAIGWGTGG